jgi:phospholipase/lecithinase/hemolysin
MNSNNEWTLLAVMVSFVFWDDILYFIHPTTHHHQLLLLLLLSTISHSIHPPNEHNQEVTNTHYLLRHQSHAVQIIKIEYKGGYLTAIVIVVVVVV